jgi:hypothetical protein
MKLPTAQLVPVSRYVTPPRSKYIHQHRVLNHLNLRASLNMRDHVSHTKTKHFADYDFVYFKLYASRGQAGRQNTLNRMVASASYI